MAMLAVLGVFVAGVVAAFVADMVHERRADRLTVLAVQVITIVQTVPDGSFSSDERRQRDDAVDWLTTVTFTMMQRRAATPGSTPSSRPPCSRRWLAVSTTASVARPDAWWCRRADAAARSSRAVPLNAREVPVLASIAGLLDAAAQPRHHGLRVAGDKIA
jgi:hypothetical protein